ncbi:hypothetical protein NM688_g7488 [Phlebia brevispora]|uniref:Uncharacterized protein n=1 Tax=Phlebia brevispora TaxID=194682 RepID=A0ACC1S4Y0_9APHY|nr:hypothetical protein NM688_g7488 [Phlebia brevispora]
MPTGTPFNSFIPPYPVRVDEFTDLAASTIPPALHLLTHTHSDHVAGLSAKSFASAVVCSQDAKEMLLRHEVYTERALHELEMRAEKVRTFQHLKVAPRALEDGTMNHIGSRDLLKVIPLRTPTRFELSANNYMTITALDANHCPGAVMYLIEGAQGAVLHTGDFRAESWYLDCIVKEPALQKYLAVPDMHVDMDLHGGRVPVQVTESLEAIYLDTACLMSAVELPSKAKATSDLVSLMKYYPPTTYFFINSWTWGYEDILKEVARSFQSKIHVDRYKYSVYMRLSDPFLRHIITPDANASRFHACERFDRCECVRVDGRASHTPSGTHVVYVNPVTMGTKKWEEYVVDTRTRLARGEEVHNLLVPLSRHSSLPELRRFVSLFKPKRIVPNTLDPTLAGLDCASLPEMFAGCVSSETDMHSECLKIWIDRGKDVALENLEGAGALEIAQHWVDSGKPRRKLELLHKYLADVQKEYVEVILAGDKASAGSLQSQLREQAQTHLSQSSGSHLVTGEQAAQGVATLSETERAMARIQEIPRLVPAGFFDPPSDEESEDEEDAHAKTAEFLFLTPDSRPAPLQSSSSIRIPSSDGLRPSSPVHPGLATDCSVKTPARCEAVPRPGIPPTPASSRHPDVHATCVPEAGECISPMVVPSAFPGHGDIFQFPQTPKRTGVSLAWPQSPRSSPLEEHLRRDAQLEVDFFGCSPAPNEQALPLSGDPEPSVSRVHWVLPRPRV